VVAVWQDDIRPDAVGRILAVVQPVGGCRSVPLGQGVRAFVRHRLLYGRVVSVPDVSVAQDSALHSRVRHDEGPCGRRPVHGWSSDIRILGRRDSGGQRRGQRR